MLSFVTRIEAFPSETIDTTFTTPSKSALYHSYDYVIDRYDINIVVNENNSFDITEKLDVHFNRPKHGIYRTLPLRNTVKRLDGTTSENRTKVTNLKVNHPYQTSLGTGDYKIKIGSENRTLTGDQQYVIQYTYHLGKDPLKDRDELYYNIIGTDWDTVIGNITFSVTMPKSFDSSKLGFSSGTYGSTMNDKIEYQVTDNVITGRYNGVLSPHEALTIRCDLPKDYFVGSSLKIPFLVYICYLMPLLCLIVIAWLWNRYGKDEPFIETVEFYPPDGLNSLNIGFLYKGKVTPGDVGSLLFDLANHGYLKIVEETTKRRFFTSTSNFTIVKLKEYDGNDENERQFFYGLFSCNRLARWPRNIPVKEITEVTERELSQRFYKTVRKIASRVNKRKNRHKIIDKKSKRCVIIGSLLMTLSYVFMVIPFERELVSKNYFLWFVLYAALFLIICFIIVVMQEVLADSRRKGELPSKRVVSNLILCCILLSVIFYAVYKLLYHLDCLILLRQEPAYLLGFLIQLSCVIGMIIYIILMPKRTPYGQAILGKIVGYRTFLEVAEKDQLEAMVAKYPTYFFDILPYTYALGISFEWVMKFRNITMSKPVWLDSPHDFDLSNFNSFIDGITASFQPPSSSLTGNSGSSSSGSSGGGLSGGGSGGGGGGSW